MPQRAFYPTSSRFPLTAVHICNHCAVKGPKASLPLLHLRHNREIRRERGPSSPHSRAPSPPGTLPDAGNTDIHRITHPSPWAGCPPTSSGCPGPHPTWQGTGGIQGCKHGAGSCPVFHPPSFSISLTSSSLTARFWLLSCGPVIHLILPTSHTVLRHPCCFNWAAL